MKQNYRFLILDGGVLKRRTGMGAVRRFVLVALGITPEGKKEIIDFRTAHAESQGPGMFSSRICIAGGCEEKGWSLLPQTEAKDFWRRCLLFIPKSPFNAAGLIRPETSWIGYGRKIVKR